MKKTYAWLIAIVSIIVVAAVVTVSIVAANKRQVKVRQEMAHTQEYEVYFLNKTKDGLTSEKRQTDKEGQALYRELLQQLIDGPKDTENHKRAINENTKILSVLTDDHNTTTVNFSKEFESANSSQTLLAAYTVAKTLTQLSDTQQVVVQVEGKEIRNNSGEPEGPIANEDIVVGTGAGEERELSVVLYFYNQDASYLEKETRRVRASSNETLEIYVVEGLIAGPKDSKLSATLNKDSKLVSIQTKDGICFVNFTGDFVSQNTGSSAQETGAIYSIVNSLTELDEVNRVQFLIDGKKTDSFGSFAFNEPFERDESLIDSSAR